MPSLEDAAPYPSPSQKHMWNSSAWKTLVQSNSIITCSALSFKSKILSYERICLICNKHPPLTPISFGTRVMHMMTLLLKVSSLQCSWSWIWENSDMQSCNLRWYPVILFSLLFKSFRLLGLEKEAGCNQSLRFGSTVSPLQPWSLNRFQIQGLKRHHSSEALVLLQWKKRRS